MGVIIYLIIIALFAVLLFWTWNNTKDFDNIAQRIRFIIIGLIAIFFITYILFNISKIGIEYPNTEIAKTVRRVAILVFIPINGFISLPHIASIKEEILSGMNDDNKTKKKIIILGIIILVAIIFEVNYLKSFQKGIISIINQH
jgi:hypothetical protein